MSTAAVDLAVVDPDYQGKPALRRSFHEGQRRAYDSTKRFVLVLAGTQSGKTSFGPHWLLQEMQRKGAGDYLVATPTFPLLEVKLLPEFRKLFETQMQLGEYRQSPPPRRFTLSKYGEHALWGQYQDVPTQVWFGYATDPDSLESATIKAAWLDEAGQKSFKLGSWEAIQRRLSINQGRALITTTPYTLGWLKSEVYDRASDPQSDVAVINFTSTANPRFPAEEYQRARRELPGWKFAMFYQGLFERPAGMIYDCWSDDENLISAFEIPEHWPRHQGVDFGGVNTAAIYLAEELNDAGRKTGRFIAYREYHAGGRTAAQHAVALKSREPRIPKVTGGSKSENQWRWEFARAGLPIYAPPIAEVEVGINRVYGLIASRNLLIFDTLRGLIDQILSYSRELDDMGEPTEKIEDKEAFHFLDALRYGVAGATGRGSGNAGWA